MARNPEGHPCAKATYYAYESLVLSIGAFIQQARTRKKKGTEQVGKAAGENHATVNALEHGKSWGIEPQRIERILKAIGVPDPKLLASVMKQLDAMEKDLTRFRTWR